MGICYDVFFFDEFDWNYANGGKNDTINQIKSIYPNAKKVGDMYGCLIFSIDKFHPSNFINKVRCDAIKYRTDDNLLTIVDLE